MKITFIKDYFMYRSVIDHDGFDPLFHTLAENIYYILNGALENRSKKRSFAEEVIEYRIIVAFNILENNGIPRFLLFSQKLRNVRKLYPVLHHIQIALFVEMIQVFSYILDHFHPSFQ